MKDYAGNDRQRLIAQAEKNPAKAHYQQLITKGLSEHDAANLSGWHPTDEYDNWLSWFVYIFCSLCIIAGLVVFSMSAQASMDLPEHRRLEKMVIACLNGGEMRFDDGSRFACVPLMREEK